MKADEVRIARAVLSDGGVQQFLLDRAEAGYKALEQCGFTRKGRPRLRAGKRPTCCWRGYLLAARCEDLGLTLNLDVVLTLRDNGSAEFSLRLMNQNQTMASLRQPCCDAYPEAWTLGAPVADLLCHVLSGTREFDTQARAMTQKVTEALVP